MRFGPKICIALALAGVATLPKSGEAKGLKGKSTKLNTPADDGDDETCAEPYGWMPGGSVGFGGGNAVSIGLAANYGDRDALALCADPLPLFMPVVGLHLQQHMGGAARTSLEAAAFGLTRSGASASLGAGMAFGYHGERERQVTIGLGFLFIQAFARLRAPLGGGRTDAGYGLQVSIP